MSKKYEISIRRDGILEICLKDNTEIFLNDTRDIINDIEDLDKNKEPTVLILPGAYTVIYEFIKGFYNSKKAKKYALVNAIVTKSLPQRLVTCFYTRNTEPLALSRAFSNKRDAVKWLKTVLN